MIRAPGAHSPLTYLKAGVAPCCLRHWGFVSVLLFLSYFYGLMVSVCRHFACCLGDTFASELGILSHSPPILITTFKPVPPGTNGAMSLGGTLASLMGGGIVGLAIATSLILENSKCREQWLSILVDLLFWGTIAGGLGSLVS
jgi:uncharacterized protein (TIGR00297 family)